MSCCGSSRHPARLHQLASQNVALGGRAYQIRRVLQPVLRMQASELAPADASALRALRPRHALCAPHAAQETLQQLMPGMAPGSFALVDEFGTDPSIGPETPDRRDYHDNSEDDDEDEDELTVDDSDFLNFSFKNLELLGERNKEMVEKMSQLRAEVGDIDPYSHAWLPSTASGTGSASSSSTRR